VIGALSDRQFANSLRGVQEQLGQFNAYRNVEKPPKFMEKGNLEVLLFTLQSKMRSLNKVNQGVEHRENVWSPEM
jgi:spectrin beta